MEKNDAEKKEWTKNVKTVEWKEKIDLFHVALDGI